MYFLEACDAFSAVGSEDAYTLEEVQSQFPGLDESAACEWAIYGFTVHGWLDFETQLIHITEYIDRLRAHADFLEQAIHNLEKAAKKQQDAVEAIE